LSLKKPLDATGFKIDFGVPPGLANTAEVKSGCCCIKSGERLRRENMDIDSEGISPGSTLKLTTALEIIGIKRQAGFA
jgi:hypothetical protein